MAIKTPLMKAALATAYGNTGAFMTMYTTVPGAAAGTEPSGGTPAFARKPVTWSGSNGTTTASATFDIPAGVTIAGWGLHTLVTVGSYLDGDVIKDGAGVAFTQPVNVQSQFTMNVTFVES